MSSPGKPHAAAKEAVGFCRRPFWCVSLGLTSLAMGVWAWSMIMTDEDQPAAKKVAAGDFASFHKNVQPFLAAHCYECHGSKDEEGDVRLDTFHDEASLAKGMPTLVKALKMLGDRKMPPKDEPRPTEDEYHSVTAWIDAYTTKYYTTGPVDPGRVTIHRLNVAEYNNTIRDLLAVDSHPADNFPADDVGYGFDNNGDVLSIAPILFEKYIKSAEVILDQAVFTDPAVPPPTKIFDAAIADGDFPKGTPTPEAVLNPSPVAAAPPAAAGARGGRGAPPVLGRVFQRDGYIGFDYDFPADGNYILSFMGYSGGPPGVARGNAAPPNPIANVLIYLDGNQTPVGGYSDAKPMRVSARAGAPQASTTPAFAVTAGHHNITLAFRNGATTDEYDAAVAAAAAAPASPAAPAADPVAAAPVAAAPAASIPAAQDPATIAVTAVPTVAVAAADPAVTSGGSDPVVSAAPVAAAPPARSARGAGAAGAAGRRGGPPPGPTSITGKTIMGVISFKVEGPEFVSPAAMPDRMPESYRRVMVAQPSDAVPSSTLTKAEAAEKIIRNFVTRAYRRPATDAEVQKYMSLWTSVDAPNRPFEKSVTTALQAVLLNPNFLFRVEQDPQPGEKNNIHTLNDYELASRLSYFLWSSMPDDELFALAAKGQLRANLDAQVARMLKDPKSQSLVDNFAGQWLHLRKVDDVNPDPDHSKDFSPELKTAMLKETQMFFASIKNEDRSVLDFIDADYSFVNEPLAKLYGLDGITGDAFQRVTFPKDSPRGGLITQASILAITSYPNRTSPVQRGKWVLENLLDAAPPPPPPNVPALDDEKQLKGTLRQQMEAHRANPACAVCHERMDAIGFSLENFDVIGEWRTKDGNNDPVDASGSLPDGTTFVGAAQLKQLLMTQQDQFCRCLADKMLAYALGRAVEPFDKRTVNDIVSTMQKNGDKFSVLVNAIVHSDAFQQRRGNPPEDISKTEVKAKTGDHS